MAGKIDYAGKNGPFCLWLTANEEKGAITTGRSPYVRPCSDAGDDGRFD